jgi:hypothetical protein
MSGPIDALRTTAIPAKALRKIASTSNRSICSEDLGRAQGSQRPLGDRC